jgi:hypothetical protein
VRQYGNLSYIRTYQAGHAIPSYQPETAYKVFTRALFNLDIATGTQSTAGSIEAAYKSAGRDVMDVQANATGSGLFYCYTYDAGGCFDWQVEMIQNGTAEICNWLFVDANSTALFPEAIAKCRADWASHRNGTNSTGPRPTSTPPPFPGAAVSVRGRGWMSVLGAAFVMVVVSVML